MARLTPITGKNQVPAEHHPIVDAASMKALQQRFGDEQFIELTGTIGYYSMLAMTVNACELEAGPGAEVLI